MNTDWLQRLMSGFALDPKIVAVSGLVLPYWEQGAPAWLTPELEPYMGSTSYLGTSSRVLSDTERVVEYNLVLERSVWEASGGFFGMEQLGCHHLGAGEGLLLLRHLRATGGKIAYMPQAVMRHHVQGRTTQHWMLRRFYWQGVGDALMDGLIREKTAAKTTRIVVSNLRFALVRVARSSLRG